MDECRLANTPNQSLLDPANQFWSWFCQNSLLLHSAFQHAEQTLILEESRKRMQIDFQRAGPQGASHLSADQKGIWNMSI